MVVQEDEKFEFTCVIVNKFFYNEETNYGIYRFETNQKDLPHTKEKFGVYEGTIVGESVSVEIGAEIKVIAKLVHHKVYRWQYKIISLSVNIPKTYSQKYCYLASITTEDRATALLNAYPNIIDDVVNNPSYIPDLSSVNGIKEKSFEKIKENILATYLMQDILALLSPLGVTLAMVIKLSVNEPNIPLLKEKILKNPYCLTDIKGITFPKVDSFAVKLNEESRTSIPRAVCATEYVLEDIADNGDCWIHPKVLIEKVKALIPDNVETFTGVLKEQITATKNGKPGFLYIDDKRAGLTKYFRMEQFIYNKLNNVNETENDYIINDFEKRIRNAETAMGFPLTERQYEGVEALLNNNVIVITGKAGTGKSSVIKAILEVYEDKRFDMATLSAKASRRIVEVSGFSQARTIHRLLEWNGVCFGRDEENPLSCDILILDECSMNSIYMFYSVLKAVGNNTKIILVGDVKQLPPIGCGNVFSDLTECKTFKTIVFDEVFRQSKESGIVTDANEIREGNIPFIEYKSEIVSGEKKDMFYVFRNDPQDILSIIVNTYINYINNGYSVSDVSVIVPRKGNKVALSTDRINKIIQDMLIPEEPKMITLGDKVFKLGCRLINKVNDYKKDIVNGEMGTLTKIMYGVKDEKTFEVGFCVRFDGCYSEVEFSKKEMENLELGYCTTVHSFQGSSNRVTIIGLDMSHYKMLSSNLIYTAVTRAEKTCLVVAQPKAFNMGVKNVTEVKRSTFLKEFLTNNINFEVGF